MKKLFIAVMAAAVLAMSCSSGTAAKVVNFGKDSVGVVKNGTVQLYQVGDKGWTPSKDAVFTLPKGYKAVLGSEAKGFGVVVNDKVQFYGLEKGAWKTDPKDDLTLPKGYKSVFETAVTFFAVIPFIGVVVGDKVEFYSPDKKGWELEKNYDFTLPKGYKAVYGIEEEGFGVEMNGVVQIYTLAKKGGWEIDKNVTAFTVPKGAQSIFCYGGGTSVGVVLKDKVQFYTLENKTWKTGKIADLMLP
jgi:hypothetical protein